MAYCPNDEVQSLLERLRLFSCKGKNSLLHKLRGRKIMAFCEVINTHFPGSQNFLRPIKTLSTMMSKY